MTDNPTLILAVSPEKPTRIQDFFSEQSGAFKVLKDPPSYRYMGWNMLTLDYPKIKGGKAWEVKNGDRKTIRIYEDGTLLAVCPADNSFLGWGKDFDEFAETPNLNTLAVIEYIYEFVRLYKGIIQQTQAPIQSVTFRISLRNVTLPNGKTLSLIPLRVSDFGYSLKMDMSFIERDFDEDVEINMEEDERYIAYKLLYRFFIQFGISPDKIPYTSKDEKGKFYIDEKTYMKE